MSTLRDLRFAWRVLLRYRRFALAVVVTLGLGVGAVASMLRIGTAVLSWQPAGIRDPQRVGRVYPMIGSAPLSGGRLPFADVAALETELGAQLDGVTAYSPLELAYEGAAGGVVRSHIVPANYFRVLGVSAVVGQSFAATTLAQEASRSEPNVVLAYAFWQRHFGGDPRTVGQTMRVGGRPYVIVGVAPPSFSGLDALPADCWLQMGAIAPTLLNPNWDLSRATRWLVPIIRVRAPRTFPDVEAALTRTLFGPATVSPAPPLAADTPERLRVRLTTLNPALAPGLETERLTVASVSALALLVLIIACGNAGSLLLARGLARRREFAVRGALGATRGTIVRQVLAESSLLSLFAWVVGVGIAAAVLAAHRPLLRALQLAPVSVDASLLLFALGVSVVVVGGAGLVPAMTMADMSQHFRAGGSERERRVLGVRWSRVLLVGQIAMAALLLVGTGLFTASFQRLRTFDLGFQTEQVFITQVSARAAGVSPATAHEFFRAAQERSARLPSVEAAGIAAGVPFLNFMALRLSMPGLDSIPSLEASIAAVTLVSADALQALQVRVLRGTVPPDWDGGGGQRYALITQSFAARVWPRVDPIGRCLVVGSRADSTAVCRQVAGIVSDMHDGFGADGGEPRVLLPAGGIDVTPELVTLMIRVRGDAEDAQQVLQRELSTVSPAFPAVRIQQLAQLTRQQSGRWRVSGLVVSGFGLVAVILVGLGLYGLLAYTVQSRQHEYAIRRALGAPSRAVGGHVAVAVVPATLIGAAAGLLAAWLAAPLLQSLLFHINARTPLIYLVAGGVLLVTACGAAILPVLRALAITPDHVVRGVA